MYQYKPAVRECYLSIYCGQRYGILTKSVVAFPDKSHRKYYVAHLVS